jgi:quercetin dioxygenase-like cupin family protein
MLAFIAAAGTGREFNVLGHVVHEKVSSEQTGGAYYAFELDSPPESFIPPHVHTREDEIIYVVSGELEVTLGSETARAGPGTLLNFARGTLHGYRNPGDGIARTAWVVVPGASFQELYRTLGSMPPGPPDLAFLDRVHARHGITMPRPAAEAAH